MSLYSYLARLEDTLRSRQDITLEDLRLTLKALGAILVANLRFYDGSLGNKAHRLSFITSERMERSSFDTIIHLTIPILRLFHPTNTWKMRL